MPESKRDRPYLKQKGPGRRGRLALLLFLLVASVATLVLVGSDDVIESLSRQSREGEMEELAAYRPRSAPEPVSATEERSKAETPGTAEATIDIEEVRVEFQDRFAELDQLLAKGGSQSPGIAGEIARLTELLRLVPEATEMVMDRLAEASCSDELASILTTCLSQAGTAAPQQGLRRILTEGRWSDTRRRMALFALVPINQPIAEFDDALMRLHDSGSELGYDALRVLAAVGDRVHDDHPKRFARIRERLELAVQGRRTLQVLEVLGNLGVDEVPPAFDNAVSDESVLVRVMAMLWLTRIRSDDAHRLLTEAAREDPSAQVRQAAKQALEERTTLGLAG
ncbi:MAG: HEAT repeat domain-containing protein [Planctomycetota bacterium]|jgi:hypothetical protein